MTRTLSCDLLVVGGGSGGLSVAAGAAQMGARVILVEKGRMGGDCLNTGCVPSKALLAAAKAAHAGEAAAAFGVDYAAPRVDFGRVHDHVHEVIAAIAPHDSVARFESLGVRVLRATARFLDHRRMAAGDHVLHARRIVLATGSRPRIPPIPGLDAVPCLTNETIFDLRERPRHLVVIGAGPIGLEMAQAFRRLGSRVTVLEKFRALPKDDPEIAAIALAALRGEGLEIREGVEIAAVSGTAGVIRVAFEDGTGSHSVEGSHLLVATGRAPAIAGLDLDAAGSSPMPPAMKRASCCATRFFTSPRGRITVPSPGSPTPTPKSPMSGSTRRRRGRASAIASASSASPMRRTTARRPSARRPGF